MQRSSWKKQALPWTLSSSSNVAVRNAFTCSSSVLLAHFGAGKASRQVRAACESLSLDATAISGVVDFRIALHVGQY